MRLYIYLQEGRMKKKWKIRYFEPDRQGIAFTERSVRLSADMPALGECGVILYDSAGETYRIPFRSESRRGTLYGMEIEGEDIKNCAYNYYMGDQIFTDPYAHEIYGLKNWGEHHGKKRGTCGLFPIHHFNWQGDEPLMTPLEESIFYGLNVRAFTMHKSSGVRHKGTFEGISEKIPHFKKLGITALELMPCYEYDECMIPGVLPGRSGKSALDKYVCDSSGTVKAAVWEKEPDNGRTETVRLNCWGFQEGFYFAPKAAYSAGVSPVISFKKLVRKLHQNGIEVIMHFYFPEQIRQLFILEVIKYWVIEYHIDGVRISGNHIPFRLLAEEPVLKNSKIWCSYLPKEELPVINNPLYRNFISDNGNFRNDVRRFLKGDEGMLNQILFYQRHNPEEHGVVNYLADYDGFSLYDCVSYEQKHNEANGEENRDGCSQNLTWNCGVEGESRKKHILELRQKQIKNALSLIFLSQGIPFLFSGDEFADSRGGNNNCYCQDNETGWVVWKKTRFAREIFSYIQFLTALRKAHPVLHMRQQLKCLDYIGCGIPDISYHGIDAWRPDLSFISRVVGIVLCGKYTPDQEDDSFYIACNMHWESHQLALPQPSRNKIWIRLSDTAVPFASSNSEEKERLSGGSGGESEISPVVTIKSRSICIFITRNLSK